MKHVLSLLAMGSTSLDHILQVKEGQIVAVLKKHLCMMCTQNKKHYLNVLGINTKRNLPVIDPENNSIQSNHRFRNYMTSLHVAWPVFLPESRSLLPCKISTKLTSCHHFGEQLMDMQIFSAGGRSTVQYEIQAWCH